MISRLAFFLIPICAFAQDHVPPIVDQALRARVKGFFQNFVDGTTRKAEPFVAADTKEYFYNVGKAHLQSFKIEKITYSDDYRKAVVVVISKEERHIAGQTIMMDVPQDTHWKIEGGKWCWYYHPEDFPITPMGGAVPPRPTGMTAVVVPKNSSPEAMRDAGKAVLSQQPMGLDKESVTFAADQPGSTTVVFINGADGETQIGLDAPVVRGLKAKLDRTSIPGHGQAILSLDYDPTDQHTEKGMWEPKGDIKFRIYVAPFDRIFPLTIQFTGK